MGKDGSRTRAQTAKAGYAVSFQRTVRDNERMGRKIQHFTRAWLPINDPDIIPEKLKADFSKRTGNTPKTIIYVANVSNVLFQHLDILLLYSRMC